MGELVIILVAFAVYVFTACICFAGYVHLKTVSRFRFVLGFFPVLNFIVAVPYIWIFLKNVGTEVASIEEKKE